MTILPVLKRALAARIDYRERAAIARDAGYDPDTAALIGELIAQRLLADIPECPGLVHDAQCWKCAVARYLRKGARIARETGDLQ